MLIIKQERVNKEEEAEAMVARTMVHATSKSAKQKQTRKKRACVIVMPHAQR